MPDQSNFQTERDLAFLLVDAGRKLNDAYDAQMKPLGLTRSQWRVMAYVSRTPGITQTQLAKNIELSRMAITGLLDRMQAKGLVERKGDVEDRRVNMIHLTNKSRELVSRMNQTAEAVLEGIFAGISPREKKSFGKTLSLIKNNAANGILS